MRQNTPLATDHQLMREGLEVLRLIGDRVEMGQVVEPGDLTTVLGFLRDVGCECLNHTEQYLLRPALERLRELIDAELEQISPRLERPLRAG